MVGADEHGAVFPAGLANAAADGGRRLHLQIGIFGSGTDGQLQQLRGLGFFAEAAGGDERNVRIGKQFLYLFVFQGAAVQADFRHLYRFQDFQNFLILFILNANANHPSLPLHSFP